MSRRDVLQANARFYSAFGGSDTEAMEALWARRASVACIHPGGPVLRHREEIVASWRSIFAAGGVHVRCVQPEVFLNGQTALVTCFEFVGEHVLLASNLFVQEDGEWKMVHHHAAATAARPAAAPEQASRAIH